MKISIDELRKLIREYYEGSEGDTLGKYAFADYRRDTPPETNNTYEEQMFRVLLNHFQDNVKVPVEYVEKMKELLNSGQYDDIFVKLNKRAEVYRGMNASEDFLKKVLDVDEIDDDGRVQEVEFNFSPLVVGGVTSWTTDYDQATNFSNIKSKVDGKSYKIILAADVSNNIDSFVSCKGLYNLIRISNYKSEAEVFGIGDIKVFGVRWFVAEAADLETNWSHV